MRRLPTTVAIVVLAGALGAAPLTLARFTASSAVSASMATGSLVAPTSLTGTNGTTAGLSWTASSSAAATGYQLLRSGTSGSGYAQVKTVTPASATSATDNPANGTWYYVMQTYMESWTSGLSNEASVRVGSVVTTAVKACANNAAETTNAGDNNGYESNAGNACATDGAYAQDANSGTDSSLSCSSTAKDKHRFWGYAFGLPASVSSITGITVEPVIGQSNNGGTAWLCIQLSGDGGGTWSPAQSVVLTGNSIATYTLGGPTDTWGRSWALDDFTTGTFRVRVIDASSQSSKDFRLDDLGVSVTYAP